MTIMNNVMTTTLAIHCREKGVRLAQTMRAGPRIGPWEYSYKRLKLAQRLGRRGVFLTCSREPFGSIPTWGSVALSFQKKEVLNMLANLV